MILTHKTGVLLHGTLAKDPVFKDVGQKQVLKFDVKAHSVKTDTGSWESLYVQVNVWHGLDKWDGMLLKGDAVTVFARELKTREYNGKTYYSVDADDIQPGGLVLFRWMQNLIDLCTEPPASPEQTSLSGGQIYPGEKLTDYAPRTPQAAAPTGPAVSPKRYIRFLYTTSGFFPSCGLSFSRRRSFSAFTPVSVFWRYGVRSATLSTPYLAVSCRYSVSICCAEVLMSQES